MEKSSIPTSSLDAHDLHRYGNIMNIRRLPRLFIMGLITAVILALSVTLLITFVYKVTEGSPGDSHNVPLDGYEGNFTSFCKVASYPLFCEATLNKDPRATNDSTAKELLLYTVDAARWQLWTINELVSYAKGNGKFGQVLADCREMLETALKEVSDASTGLASGDFEDAPTWLTTATTNNDECREELTDLGASNETSVQAVQWQARSADWQLANALSLSLSVGIAATNSTAESSTAALSSRRKLLGVEDLKPAGEVDVPLEKIQARGIRMLAETSNLSSNITVAPDGTGDFRTIQAAIDSISSKNKVRIVVVIHAGTYLEQVTIDKPLVTLQGAGVSKTIITGAKSVTGGYTTYTCCTVCTTTSATGFIAQDITFVNSAGVIGQQAVAFRSDGDLSVFNRCNFHGYQDTLYMRTGRAYFYSCTISGTVDFIFGNGAAVFQSCKIYIQPTTSTYTGSVVTAHGRTSPSQPTGFVFNEASIFASRGAPVGHTYFGRPWKTYARVVFLRTYLSDVMHVDRWLTWNGDTYQSLPYLGEYKSTGPGAAKYNRPKWVQPFFVPVTELVNFKPTRFLGSRRWVPAGIPVKS